MKRFLLVIAFIILGINLNAQSTIIDYDAYSLKFTVTNESNAECSVACSTPPTAETVLTIPSSVTIDGIDCTVTSIADNGFYECEMFVGDLVIPNTVTEIGDRAFRNSTGFNGTITLSENLKSIGEMAFGCGSGKTMNFTGKLTIPSSVEYMGRACYQNCAGLTSLEFEENSKLTSINEYAFYACKSLAGELIIPDGVTVIGKVSFRECEALTSLHLPDGVTTIEESAFESSGIITVNIPNSITNLGNRTFFSCKKLETVTFDDDMQIDSISGYFVYNCIKLKNIEIPDCVKAIGERAFANSGLKNIEIPSGVTAVRFAAFSYCSKLSSIISNPEAVPVTSAEAFSDCPIDMKIYVPASSVDAYKSASQWNNFAILPMGEGIVSLESEDRFAFEVYPNPSEVNAQINLGDTFNRVEVYNAAGAKVVEYKETDNISGIETSGVYFIKAVNDDKVRTCRIVVK